MATSIWLGNKIRRMRREQGVAQVVLAKKLGISASYLNMIERNQRPLTLRLLERVSEVFEVSAEALAQDDDARLHVDLMEMFGDPVFHECDVTRDDLRDIVNVAPAAGRALLDLYRVFRRTREDVDWLRERMTDDNFLSTSAYELRSVLTPIRSFAEILYDHEDIGPEDQHRFAGILVRESERLAEIVGRMLSLSPGDGRAEADGVRSPDEQVTDFVQDRMNYFPSLEEAAEEIRRKARVGDGLSTVALIDRLADAFRLGIEVLPVNGEAQLLERRDGERRTLRLAERLPYSSRAFRLAKWIGLQHFGEAVDDCIPDDLIEGKGARELCREVLAGYLAGAVILPYDRFLADALASRYDIELLESRFQASFEQVCHRMTTLQRPGAAGVPLHLVKVDIAGNVAKRFSISGLRIPRYGGVCPRSVLHAAFMAPGRIGSQVERLTDGSTYFSIARTVSKPAIGGPSSVRHFALALGCDIAHAERFVYSDGIDLESDKAVTPIGVTCRVCDRMDCGQRAQPPVLRPARNADPNLAAAVS